MRSKKRRALVLMGSLFVLLPARHAASHGQQLSSNASGQLEVWAPLPERANPFVPPNKPLTRIAELLAKHTGEREWAETIVSDNLFRGDYILMAAGAKTRRRFHQDNRAFWIVQDGQIRFTIEGQAPFVAS